MTDDTRQLPSPDTERVLQRLDDTMTRLNGVLERKEAEELKAKHQASHRFSRGSITLALALAGMKMSAVLGAKIGIIYSAITDKLGPISLKLENLPKEAERGWRVTRHGATGAAISGFVGAAIIGTLGWVRSNRIKDPDDLVHKPFDSLARLFGPERKEDSLAAAPASTHVMSAGSASQQKNWQAQEAAKKVADKSEKRTIA